MPQPDVRGFARNIEDGAAITSPDEALARADEPNPPDRASIARALRDLEATEARIERNAKWVYDESRGKLVLELLPVLDSLDRTVHAAATTSDRALLEGVRMVRAQLESVLLRYGLDPVESTGHLFDPAIHDAISVAPVLDPKRHNLVIHQAEAGFRFAGKLLRPAKVVVGKLAAAVEARRHSWRT